MSRRRGLTRRAWVRVALVTSISLLLAGRWLAINHVEWLWAESLGILATHQAIGRLRLGLFALALAVAAVWCTGNLLLIYRSIGSVQVPRRLGNLEFVEAVPRRYLLWGTVGLGLATALLLSHGARDWWDDFALLGANGGGSLRDPVLHRDVGYYLFTLPWQRAVQRFFLALTGVVALLTILLYGAVGALQWSGRRLIVSEVARAHLAGVLAAFAVALLFGFRLDPAAYIAGLHGVPYDTVLVGVRIPVAGALATLSLMVALASLGWVWVDRIALVAVPWIGLGVAAFTGRFVVPGFAAAVRPPEQRAIPEVAVEQRRLLGVAYGLPPRDTVVEPPVAPDPSVLTTRARELALAPVWDDFVLVDLLNRVAGRRPHDRFQDATLSLYPSAAGAPVPLFVAARQVDLARARQAERALTWEEMHRAPYAYAVGVVAVQANAASPSGLPLFVSGAERPAVAGAAVTDLTLSDSLVRFSPTAGPFMVVSDSGVAVGLRVAGSLRRLALAWVLQSPRLLSGGAVPPASRILWRRSVVERLDRYAPFARFGVPYAVVAGGRLLWLSAGYVRAPAFPLSILVSWRGDPVRYLRAGFIGVVDAHSGETAVFLLEPGDPIAAAWARLAPDIIRPSGRLPPEVWAQVRYPVELFHLQVALLLRDTSAALPVLPARRAPAVVSGVTADAPRPAAPFWMIGAFPGDSVPGLRLRAAVERGDPPLLAMVVDGVMRDGRPALETVRLALPLVHPAPVEVGAASASAADGGTFAGPAKPFVFSDALVTVRSVYASAEAAEAVPRLRDVTVGMGPIVGRGRSLADAMRRAQLALRLPTSRGAPWSELRDWFDRLESARAAGDWAAFGRAYEQLRRLLGVPRDTSQ